MNNRQLPLLQDGVLSISVKFSFFLTPRESFYILIFYPCTQIQFLGILFTWDSSTCTNLKKSGNEICYIQMYKHMNLGENKGIVMP